MIKLIRDNIPELIKKEGKVCNFASAQNDELYTDLLRAKLYEEVQEFLASGSIEELADLTEVAEAIVQVAGVTKEDFQQIKDAKTKTNGGFTKRYIGFFPDPQPAKEETK